MGYDLELEDEQKDFEHKLQVLMLVIAEEWGEVVKKINDYIWNESPDLEGIQDEICQVFPPLVELFELVRKAK